MPEFLTYIDIDAPIQTAWNVLQDFAGYPDWNPVARSIDGGATRNERLTLHLAKNDAGTETFRVKVVLETLDEPRELAWRGGAPGMPFLVDVLHAFRLQDLGEGRTRLEHYEGFKGLLIPLVAGKLRKTLPARYQAYNEAFKARCESLEQNKS